MASRSIYMVAVMDALQALGGQASPVAVYGWLKSEGRIRQTDLDNPERDEKWLHREIRFARQELFLGGLIDGANRGLWRLTEEGRGTTLSIDTARELVNRRHHPASILTGVAIEEDVARVDPETEPVFSAHVAKEGPTLGPAPTAWSATVKRSVEGSGWTYSMRFGDRDVWKIGHTTDVAARLVELNKHVPHEALGERWAVFLTREWTTSHLAYAMEQEVFSRLEKHRTIGERVHCSATDLVEAWKSSEENET